MLSARLALFLVPGGGETVRVAYVVLTCVCATLGDGRYSFDVEGVDGLKGSFTTFAADVKNVRMIAAACDKDKPKNRGPVNMWCVSQREDEL